MKIDRKTFIKRAIGAVLAFEFIWILRGSFANVGQRGDDHELFDAGEISTFEKGKVYPFTTGNFFLKRFQDGGFLALSSKCTHLGCRINIDPKTDGFVCPCHSSHFDGQGEVTISPAARPLDMYEVSVKDGHLFVHTNKAIKRQSFIKNQLTYA